MMTSANPIAISRSRVQTRISFLKEWIAEGAGAEGSGTGVATVGFWSVLGIFLLLSIYNTGVTNVTSSAKLDLRAPRTSLWQCSLLKIVAPLRALPATVTHTLFYDWSGVKA
jgi:hypothetical protein